MPDTTAILKSQPGIKRDGTKYEGDFYVDGQWVRFQRGLPRKMAGYRSTQKSIPEISRGFTSFTQQNFVYCHTGGSNILGRFTIDGTYNASVVTDRTPVAAASTCQIVLTGGGGAGSKVETIVINGVNLLPAHVPYATSLAVTAANVVTSINSGTGTHGYTATSVGATITISASISLGSVPNNYVVTVTTTTITFTKTNMGGGSFALIPSAKNLWMFDYQYDSSASDNYIIAHASPNMQCICNDQDGQIFFGDALGTAPLKSISLPTGANATGGIVSLHPYLMYYGTDGIIGWSKPGEPTNMTDFTNGAGLARVWGQKIVKGMPLRAGSGTAPAGIFWAYDAVIRATFSGGSTVFQFDIIATDTSIISPQSVVDYDGIYFWCGADRFLMFNGVVREVPNQMNLNYFFDGLNRAQRNKVFAFKVPRFGEIWWCYPRDDATECTHAVIYNLRENCWYDTELPNSGRSAGAYSNAFTAPILVGVVNDGSGYKAWAHEQFTDEYDGPNIYPIKSWFETADLSRLVQGADEGLRITMIEPDFVQSGPMEVVITGRANARAPEVYSTTFTFPDTATETYQQIVMLKEQRRELRVKFQSNSLYGDYQMGQIIAHFDAGDRRAL